MKFLVSTLALLGFTNLAYAQEQIPPTLTIGEISDLTTEFNVGEGNTDETTSYNHIQITGTAGIDIGLTNNPGASPAKGTKYYAFTILAPGCAAPGSGAVSLKTSYDTDGHLTGTDTVDLELAVAAWDASNHAITGPPLKFGVCIQADIMMVNEELAAVVIERKHFDFTVSPILSTFTVTSDIETNAVDVGTSTGEQSGTTVTPLWKGTDPLPPGEPIWFDLTVNNPAYNFVSFETVTMTIGAGDPTNLIENELPVDDALTSSELSLDTKKINFYHILPRSSFGATPQTLTFEGKALVDYVGITRRLRGAEDGRELATEPETTDFEIVAMMMADEGGDSGSFTIEILSVVIGGVGAVGAALL